MPLLLRFSGPVMAARWASVTRAQWVTPEIRPTIASRTCSVRPQMPAVASNTAVTVALSVSGAVPREVSVARPVTVRVKVSSVPSASAGIVTTGVALAASSNVTVTPLGLVSAQL